MKAFSIIGYIFAILFAVGCNEIGVIKSAGFNQPKLIPISIPNLSVVEGTPALLVLSLGTPSPKQFDLRLTLTGVGAGSDFSQTTITTSVPAGSTSVTTTITTLDNFTYEGSRTYLLTVDSVDGSVIAPTTADFEITDNELPGAPTVSIDDVSLSEGSGAGPTVFTFTVTPSFAPSAPLSINWTTGNGTATTADSDFSSASGTINFSPGETSKTISVNVLHDLKFEVNETFNVSLSGGSGYTAIGSDLSGTGTIVNDDTPPTISINSPTIAEGSSGTTALNFTVTLSSVSGVSTEVNYTTADGTATLADSDYATTSGTLIIPAGSSTGTISVNVIGDARFESNETFSVNLSGGSNYTSMGSTLTGTGTITNDDTAPTISMANISANEGSSAGTTTFTFTVTSSAISSSPVTVNYATSDGSATTGNSDYVSASGTATIAAGSTTTTFSVTVNHDTVYEANEIFNVTLSGGSGYTILGSTLSATGTITNDDTAPTISIANISANEGTGGTTSSFTFTVTASTTSGQNISVNYATSDGTATIGDNDYTSTSGTATILAGFTSTTIIVPIIHDSKNEANENFNLTLSGGSGYTSAGSTLSATATITNDDTAPTVQWSTASQSVNENGTSITVTAQLSAVTGLNVSVPFTLSGTATGTGTDYSVTASPITILAGSTTATATVTIVNDTNVETNETVILTIGTPTNATASGTTVHTLTILDDDISAFTISGVQSATLDTVTDAYLNYESAPKFIYAAATGATSYDVTVYESDGTTVICALQNTALTTFSPSSCSLTPGSSYRLKVSAKNANNFSRDATNSLYSFTYNRAPAISSTRGTWYYVPGTARVVNVISDDPATGANDPATDADGDTLTVTAVSTATNGTASVSAPQSISYTGNTNFDGTDSFNVTISDGRGGEAITTVNVSVVSPFRWVGLGANTNWNTNLNWCGAINTSSGACSPTGGTPPNSSQIAYFGSFGSAKNATINTTVSVLGIHISSAYSGTITQNAGMDLTIGTSGLVMNGGTFVGSSDPTSDVFCAGQFRLAATTNFTAPTGTLTFNTTGTTTRVLEFFGTFNHHSGTVVFGGFNNSGASTDYTLYSLDVATTLDLYKMTVNIRNNSSSTPSSNQLTYIEPTDIVRVANDLTFTAGAVSKGIIELSGNLITICSTTTNCPKDIPKQLSAQIYLVGSTNTTYTVTDNTYGTPSLPRIIVNKNANSTTVTSTDNRDIQFSGLDILSGSFTAPSGIMTIGRTYAFPLSNMHFDTGLLLNGGVFNHGNGTIKLSAQTSSSTGGLTGHRGILVDLQSPITVNNLVIDMISLSSNKYPWVGFTTGSTINVLGNLDITSGKLSGGTINLYGNLVASCSDVNDRCAKKYYYNSTSTSTATSVVFKGNSNQTYTMAANAWAPGVIIEKDSLAATVSPVGASPLNMAWLEVRQGTLNLSTTTTTIGQMHNNGSSDSKGFIWAAGAGNGAINHNNGTLYINPESINNGSYASNIFSINLNAKTLSLHHVTLDVIGNSSGYSPATATIVPGDLLQINGNLTVNSGSIITNNFTATPTASENIQVYGNLSIACVDLATYRCAFNMTNNGSTTYASHIKLKGPSKTITQAAGATFPFKRVSIDLSDNLQDLTLLSNLNATSALSLGAFSDLYLITGGIELNGFNYTNIKNLDVSAGTSCSGALGYSTSSGVTGSGCGP